MPRGGSHPPPISFHLALNAAALSGAAALMILLAARGPGFSSLRLLLIGATVGLALAAGAAALHMRLHRAKEKRITAAISNPKPPLGIALASVFILFWCLTWFPPQYTGDTYYYFIGLYPLILSGLLAAGSAMVLMIPRRRGSSTAWWTKYFREHRQAYHVALLALAAFALVALLTAQFRILQGNEPYWYGAGVPLLAAQVLAASLVAVLALSIEHRPLKQRPSADLIVFGLVWAVTAILWATRPVPAGFWVTAPRAPTFEPYPFSDAVTYDLGSQFALIGQGLYNRMFLDRALYMSFLVYLHMLAGQDYQRLMSIQAAVFAVFPALLYLIGKKLHSRTAGLTFASLVSMRGLTSLDASAWIDTAAFKHMLTDFPTAIGVAVFAVLILHWAEAPRARPASLVWAGGVLGLASLLRPHVLVLMAATALLAAWIYRAQWKRALGVLSLTSLAFLVAVLPWMTLGPSSGSLLTLYGQRVETVIAQRFPRPSPTPKPAPLATSVVTREPPATPTVAQAPVSTPLVLPSQVAPSPPASNPPLHTTRGVLPPPDPGVPFAVDHFLHNLVTSAMIFPDTPQLLSVRSVVKEGEDFWHPRWNGGMSALSAIMLVLSLCAVAFGIGTAVRQDRLRGLVPIAVLLLYAAANAAARTSGGRYIVPVDWILIGYFAVAIAEFAGVFRAFLRTEATGSPAPPRMAPPLRAHLSSRTSRDETSFPEDAHRGASRPLVILLLVLLLGALVPLSGELFPRRYAVKGNANLARNLRSTVPEVGSRQAIEAFLMQPEAVLAQGRLLYPGFYRQGEGEPISYAPYVARDYPRTVFVLIGPRGILYVLLPGERPRSLPNASDALVLGCRYSEEYPTLISALVVVLPDQQTRFLRSPAVPLDCPLPEPVCDNNGLCR